MQRCSPRVISCPMSLLAGGLVLAGCSSPSSTAVLSAPSPQLVTLVGTIRESGTHAALADARVCWVESCANTAADGSFRLDTAAMAAPNYSICVVASKQGFEWRNDCV